MPTWVDVVEGDWFYNEVVEASNIYLEDGKPLIEGIPYNVFQDGAPYIYEEHIGSTGKKIFSLSQNITPTADNPLYVYVDGVQTVYKSITVNATTGNSDVELYFAPKLGAVVSFASYGIPDVDKFGKSKYSGIVYYPKYTLQYASTYYYDPFSRKYQEYVYAFGRPLKRISIPLEEWSAATSEEEVVKKYIGYKQDVYTISPSGTVYLPYNLNNVSVKIVYTSLESDGIHVRSGTFKATSPNVMHNNRFFPNAYITRAEAYTLINRLRQTFYNRFTDLDAPSATLEQIIIAYNGQKVFRLNGNYPAGEGKLLVTVDGNPKTFNVDYTEFDNHTVLFNEPLAEGQEVYFYFNKTTSDRFADVGVDSGMYVNSTGQVVTIDGDYNTSWWAPHILAMEDETFADGQYLINGMNITNFYNSDVVVDEWYSPIPGSDQPQRRFMPYSLLTRAEAVTFLNRFRKWCIERFK